VSYREVKLSALAMLSALSLSACGATFDYDGLKQAEFAGDSFNAKLSRAYRAFSVFESDEMHDWTDAAHFGEKAFKSARGEPVDPEDLSHRRFPAEKLSELGTERRRLVALLSREVRQQSPAVAAKAQASFDCWVEQQEENWQWDHISRCREGYFAAAAHLERQLGRIEAPLEAKPVVPVVQAGRLFPIPAPGKSYTLLFGFDSAVVDPVDRLALEQIGDIYQSGAPVVITIGGHADRAGPEPYNANLSVRRAEAVRKLLLEQGIPIQMIVSRAFGENAPAVKTGNGVREPKNRRVEITIGRAQSL